jgi:hypothetical protein
MRKIILFAFLLCSISQNAFPVGAIVYNTAQKWNACSGTDYYVFLTPTAWGDSGVTILKTINDDFTGNTLDKYWTFETGTSNGSPRGFYDFQSGQLRLISAPPSGTPNPLTEWWWGVDTAPKTYQEVNPNDDFSIETYITNPLDIKGYETRGVFLRKDSNNAIAAAIATDDNFARPVSLYYNNGTNTAINYSQYNSGIYFKIVKNGTSISTYYGSSRISYILMQTYKNIVYDKAFVGIYEYDTSESPAWGLFDYFYYTGPIHTEGNIQSTIENIGSTPIGTGTIRWSQNLPSPETSIELYVQTSNNPAVWSDPWTGPYINSNGENILSANAQFFRFRAKLKTTDTVNYICPELYSVTAEYPNMPPNKPVITSSTHEQSRWINNSGVSLSWSGADAGGVTVGAYYFAINCPVSVNSEYISASVTTKNLIENDGVYNFNLIAQADFRNNNLISAAGTYSFNIDTRPPIMPAVTTASHQENVSSGNNNVHFIITSVDDTAVTTNVSGIQGYSYIISRNIQDPGNTINSYSGDIQANGLSNGQWYFNAKAIDNAGNISNILSYCIMIDYKGKILDGNYVKIFPTISSNNTNINYDLNGSAKKVDIEIKDSSGKTIKTISGTITTGNNNIVENVSKYTNGVYFIKILALREDGIEDIVVKKFVVKK